MTQTNSNTTTNTPLPQQQTNIPPQKPKSKTKKKLKKILWISMWIFLAFVVGFWSSSVVLEYNEIDSYCAEEDAGFPVQVRDNYSYQYNTVSTDELSVDTPLGVIPLGVIAECHWRNTGPIYMGLLKILGNVLIFAIFFIAVDRYVRKKSNKWLYFLNVLFVGILYLLFAVLKPFVF